MLGSFGMSSARTIAAMAVLLLPACQGTPPATQDEIRVAAEMNAKEKNRNMAVQVAFDPAKENLVVDAAPSLVVRYALKTAWAPGPDYKSDQKLRSYRGVKAELCNEPGHRLDRRSGRLMLIGGQNKCALESFDQPTKTPLRITLDEKLVEQDGEKVIRSTLTIARPGNTTQSLVVYSPNARDYEQMAPVLANALGLADKDDATLASLADLQPLLDQSAAQTQNGHESQLAALLAGDRNGLKLDPLKLAPEIIAASATQIVEQFVREQRKPSDATGARRKAIGDLLARLPAEDWQRHGQVITAALAEYPAYPGSDLLVARLGELGANAIPAIEDLMADQIHERGRIEYSLAKSACTVGALGGRKFGPHLLQSWTAANEFVQLSSANNGIGITRPYRHYRNCLKRRKPQGEKLGVLDHACWRRSSLTYHDREVYLALLRVGMRPEADRFAKHDQAPRFHGRAIRVGPHSPASVCEGSILD